MSLFRRNEPSTHEPAGPPSGEATDDLRFQLREAERTVSALEGDLERTRAQLAEVQRRSGGADEVATAIGQPLAHLATQVALVQSGQGQLDARDLAKTGHGLIKALASAGIALEGTAGEQAGFDPNRHLSLQGTPEAGEPVVVRSPAVLAPSGQVVRQATVEPAA